MKKDRHYFPHDTNARNDERVLILRDKFENAKGYGIYFFIIESMAETKDGYLSMDSLGGLSLSYGLAKAELMAIVEECVALGLFKKSKNGSIYSERMIEHKKFRIGQSKNGLIGAKNRWKSKDGIAIGQANSIAIATPMQIKEKKIKEYIHTPKSPKGDLPRPGKKIEIPEDLKDNEPEILEWLKYKKESGKPYKSGTAISKFLNRLRQIPKEKRRESIDYSMANNWQGLFEKSADQRPKEADEVKLPSYEELKKAGRL